MTRIKCIKPTSARFEKLPFCLGACLKPTFRKFSTFNFDQADTSQDLKSSHNKIMTRIKCLPPVSSLVLNVEINVCEAK